MKKIVLSLTIGLILAGCSSTDTISLEEKYGITKSSVKEWDKTISRVIEEEALIPDWYGGENPIVYLGKSGKLTKKDYDFLMNISTEKTEDITDEDYEKFLELVKKYKKKMPRKFYLSKENLKNPKGLVDKMVSESYLNIETPSKHIKDVVATEEEWEKIVEFSKKSDLDEKDTKKLKNILNKFIKRDEFFEENVWYNKEVSSRLVDIVNISRREKSSLEKNNVNAKALYIAYPEYLSPLEKWKD